MSVELEFSKNSQSYGRYNIIQKSVRDEVLKEFSLNAEVIADLGCGDGALYKALSKKPKKFIAIDFSEAMLKLHPEGSGVIKKMADFNEGKVFNYLQAEKIEYLFSLSALQWADDLDRVFKNISLLNCDFSLAIFTSNTFNTLHKTAKIEPILRSAKEVETLAKKHLNFKSYTKSYTLKFESTREMLRYIKKSGVSGSRNVLSVAQTRALMREYPLEYLEFEVLFLYSK